MFYPLVHRLSRASICTSLRAPRFRGSYAILKVDSSQAVAWVRLHERVDVTVGALDTFNAFHEIVPCGALLPARFSKRFENALRYATYLKLGIAQRTSFDTPVSLVDLYLRGIKFGDEGAAQVDVTVLIERDLLGKATAFDTHTKSMAETGFKLLD